MANLEDLQGSQKLSDAWQIIDRNEKALNDELAEHDQRITNIVAGAGDSNTEIVDARLPDGGTSFPTLKDRLDTEHGQVVAQLADTVGVDISAFGTFGTANDNAAFLSACASVTTGNNILIVQNKTINLVGVTVPELPSMSFKNARINLSGNCVFNRSLDNFFLENVNIVSADAFTTSLFEVAGVTNMTATNFRFYYEATDANRCSQVFDMSEMVNVEFIEPEITGADIAITVRDTGSAAVSRNIKFNNPTFRNCKTGIYLSAINTPYTTANFVSNVKITNAILINTEAQSNSYTGSVEGADLIMCERVKDIYIDAMTCEYPVERVAYFNVVENLTIGRVMGYNAEGVKIAGRPDEISRNFVIDEINLVNTTKGNYAFRSYFVEQGDIAKITLDNSKMAVKPTNAISMTSYNKTIRIHNLFVDGLSSSLLINRLDELYSSLGYAYVAFTPIFEGIEILNSTIRNICLSNANSNILDFRFTFAADNPAYVADPNILDGKQIIVNLLMDNVDIDPRNAYQGKIANFRCAVGLKIRCIIRRIRSLYAYRFIAYDDTVSQNASKKIQMDIYSPDFPTAYPASHDDVFLNADVDSYVNISYKKNIVYRIFKNNNAKTMADMSIPSEFFKRYSDDPAFIFLAWTYASGESYTVVYSDSVEDATATVDGSGTVTITKAGTDFVNTNTDTKLCLYSSGGFIRLINRTTSNKLATVRFIRSVN